MHLIELLRRLLVRPPSRGAAGGRHGVELSDEQVHQLGEDDRPPGRRDESR